tara:strand:- start:1318 stop:1419 length:102 start_codon:yes stop_codon:yes gene_type:complete
MKITRRYMAEKIADETWERHTTEITTTGINNEN